ncbi:MAG: hypothetical protein QOG53_523 [Frankiales bacterium]|jgi:hypothetical protein|nr:hypothetical protein [Frankiales bacterium]
MPKTTEKQYAEDLIDKGLAVLQSAQNVALSGVQTGIENLKSLAPEAHSALGKVDVVDARQIVDSAFDATTRVVAQTRSFVGELLGSVLQKNQAA